MEYIQLEHTLYQILHGKYYIEYNKESFISVPNTIKDKYESSLIYNSVMNDILYEDMLTWEHAQRISHNIGIWTTKEEAGLKDLEKMLENTKLQLFLNYTNPSSVSQLKKKISNLKKGIAKSNNNKHKLYHATKESYAENIKRQFLAAVSIRDKDNNPIYNMDNFWQADTIFIEAVIEHIDRNFIPIENIRELARSEPWRSMWIAQKGDVLGKPAVEWTEYQRILCSFSRMYDNVYESTECPPEEVIEDDDILDGWFVKQKKDREDKKSNKSVDNHFSSHKGKGRQEMFIMANNKEEAQTIMNYNDPTSKMIVESRNQIVKAHGGEVIKEQQMPDVQRDLQIQATQDRRNSIRRMK
jgi:hypothetical protein